MRILKRQFAKFLGSLAVLVITSLPSPASETVSLHKECLKTMTVLTDALEKLCIDDPNSADYRAIQCPSCNVLHTRAAEAVFPFALRYKISGEEEWADRAIRLGDWLVRQQQTDGSWKETPEEWTGTTTDQLLMMLLAFPILKEKLGADKAAVWAGAMEQAANFLVETMSPDFASINYCATTTATLAQMNKLFPDARYAQKAKELARQVIAKMDDDGFIHGEGDRVYGEKYGADIGYEIDMSLWGLGMYSKLLGDSTVERYVKNSLKNHLYFVYPNGAIDGSWGIRSNKWTTYGSETADGCQILFSLFGDDDPSYMKAAWKNLLYLNSMIQNGLIGYGPIYFDLFDKPPCIYPTFVRSKNLAMTILFGQDEIDPEAKLPSEEGNWVRLFQTVDVAVVRTKNYMATIPAYGYKELTKRNKSKYMHRPTGGTISNLWVQGHGFLQLSSQTEYHRWEPMHFPEIGDVLPLTPRIEFENDDGYFTNLYEFDGRMTVEPGKDGTTAVVTTSGELCDHTFLPGGVAYTLEHKFKDCGIEKTVRLRYHDGRRDVRLVEPFVFQNGMSLKKYGPNMVKIVSPQKSFVFRLLEGDGELVVGRNADKYWAAFPSLRAFPIEIVVKYSKENFRQTIRYEIVMDGDR